jgi:hypothetical protein
MTTIMDKSVAAGVLRLAPDADHTQVRRAYRRLAAQHHPDRNPGDAGAEARFKEVHRAYLTLTGRAVRPDNTRSEAAGVLAQCLGAVLAEMTKQGKDPTKHDLLHLMRQTLDNATSQNRHQLHNLRGHHSSLTKVQGRFTTKEAALDNLMEAIVLEQVRVVGQQLLGLEHALGVLKEALGMLDDYSYRHEPVKSYGVNAASTATATYVMRII